MAMLCIVNAIQGGVVDRAKIMWMFAMSAAILCQHFMKNSQPVGVMKAGRELIVKSASVANMEDGVELLVLATEDGVAPFVRII